MACLFDTINRWKATPFVWGQSDCMIVLADWVMEVRGVDPAADIRGRYHDEASCEAVTGFMSRPLEVAARRFEDVGLGRVGAAQIGDVALISIGNQVLGAIWNGAGWVSKSERGAHAAHPRFTQVLACWGVGYAA